MPAQLTSVPLPDFGLPTVEPTLDANIYHSRLEHLQTVAGEHGYDLVLVYADREHSANLSYVTGYDPRFEEALLIVNVESDDKPLLLVGNEGYGFSDISPIRDRLEVILYQSFSLLGQDRSRSKPLKDILAEAGIGKGSKLGVIGWKYFGQQETNTPQTWLELPAYLVDTLRDMTGGHEQVVNASVLLMDSSTGLRATNELDQLARFEFIGTHASQAVRNVLFGVKPGMTEFEAAQLMQLNGLPLSCHVMLSAGERAFLGMGSPTSRVIQHGDPFTNALGLWGNLTSRAGFMVASQEELPDGIKDYLDKLVIPYFEAITAWYEHIGIGVTGAEIYDIIHSRLSDPFFGVHLNPGHLIHLDEWLNSPIYAGSTETLTSGMAVQVDVIPATGSPYYTTNIEDGILLADESLRTAFASNYPEAWKRIQARRKFMADTLGISLKPEVLPVSNIPA
ncbi:MAG: aminopeptidase P family protein [Deinococcota bacterium]